jgi:superfamily II DNA/RNA helicase
MTPEFQSKRVYSITRAKGKMFEFGIAEESHLAVPEGVEPASLFLLTIGILGDFAAMVISSITITGQIAATEPNEIQFAASYFDSFLSSRFEGALNNDVKLFAAAAYYLGERPGSSLVMARQLEAFQAEDVTERLLRWILQADWKHFIHSDGSNVGNIAHEFSRLLAFHFFDGSGTAEIHSYALMMREVAYREGSSRKILFVDLAIAIAVLRLRVSAWNVLPRFTRVSSSVWTPVIRRADFPKELWPSQILLGNAGLFDGKSGLIQMPTSAGKTRAVEIILRSGISNRRAKLSVIIAPFRALCHEIATSLRAAFVQEKVTVNEISDALQIDFLSQLAVVFDVALDSKDCILVLTPEKFLYILRQQPQLAMEIGIVVYDEGHQFDSGARGITYELLLTEIKSILPVTAQTILISAVIKNALAVADWLIGDAAVIVDGANLLPTTRSVAFASWAETLGQLMFYDSNSYTKFDYFVPRVIEQSLLQKFSPREKQRYFPERGDATKDVALYLGISVVANGTVAIFCGTKPTADSLIKRVVEIYARGYLKPAPHWSSSPAEIDKMCILLDSHFGPNSDVAKAGRLGVFVHHGNTPQGLRLAVEYGMQVGYLRFVICTSTLAQGVNLPIRYLIVSGVYQAGERIKTRDFQNLIGRAGRAGMHTEGMIIFADPSVLDEKASEGWRFDMSVNLLSSGNAEDTSSSLLKLIAPLMSLNKKRTLLLASGTVSVLLLAEDSQLSTWAASVERSHRGFNEVDLLSQLDRRRRMLAGLESYLMANRGHVSSAEFQIKVAELATSTLAYALASDSEREELYALFSAVAINLDRRAPVPAKQFLYSKTLLGIQSAIQIEAWVDLNRASLLNIESNEAWLNAVWPLLSQQSNDQFFHSVFPNQFSYELVRLWMDGQPYWALEQFANESGATKPYGKSRQKLSTSDIIKFCENKIAYDVSLVVAAIAQFLFGGVAATDAAALHLSKFQKSLKYGLPNWLAISAHEHGLADRMVAQALEIHLRADGYLDEYFNGALVSHRATIEKVLLPFPSYFGVVLQTL